MRAVALLAIASAAPIMALTGCHGSVTSHAPAVNHGNLTQHQFDAAVKIARHEASASHAKVTSATALIKNNAGPHAPSNTGHPCTSKKVLRIKLIGSFPDVSTGGIPTAGPRPPGASSSADSGVTAMYIKADSVTGVACLIGVSTGRQTPDPGSTTLFQ